MSEGFNATQREIEILELRKENQRLRAALLPFCFTTLPHTRKSIIDFDRNGLRRLMSPMEIACRDAAKAVSESPAVRASGEE